MSILGRTLRDLLRPARDETSVAAEDRVNPLVRYLESNPDGRLVHKWRHYFDIYHRHLARFRGQAITVVEIGVFNGGSLHMWRDYFGRRATIVGVDCTPECEQFAEPGIEIVIGDQGDRAFLRSLAARYGEISILLDDGGHQMPQQIATFEELYPRLRPDGVYLCEDTHSSYLREYGGGYRRPDTFMESVKPLVDRLNAYYSQDPSRFAPDEFTRTTDSMHFYDSVLVIEKGAHPPPQDMKYGRKALFHYGAPSLAVRNDEMP